MLNHFASHWVVVVVVVPLKVRHNIKRIQTQYTQYRYALIFTLINQRNEESRKKK